MVRRIDPHVTRIIDRQEAAGFGRGCSRMRKCEIGAAACRQKNTAR